MPIRHLATGSCVAVAVLAATSFALAWSPGPFPLRRMAVEADAIVVGRVTSVKSLERRGAYEISRGTIDVKRWVLGGGTKRIAVLFHSRSKGDFDLPYELKRGERVLLFLSTKLRAGARAPMLSSASSDFTPAEHEYVLQFAKAANVGYKLSLSKKTDRLSGFMDAADPKDLVSALDVVKAHVPRAPVSGLQARLWAHEIRVRHDDELHLEVRLQNVAARPLRFDTYRTIDELTLELRSLGGDRIGTLEVYADLAIKKRRASTPDDVATLDPGAEHEERVSVHIEKAGHEDLGWRSVALAPGRYLVRARYTRKAVERRGGPVWAGVVESNDLVIRVE